MCSDFKTNKKCNRKKKNRPETALTELRKFFGKGRPREKSSIYYFFHFLLFCCFLHSDVFVHSTGHAERAAKTHKKNFQCSGEDYIFSSHMTSSSSDGFTPAASTVINRSFSEEGLAVWRRQHEAHCFIALALVFSFCQLGGTAELCPPFCRRLGVRRLGLLWTPYITHP